VITEYVDNLEFRYRPALGPTWHHCVTTRLVMYHSGSRKQRQRIDAYESHDVVTDSRVIGLTKSPIAGPAQFGFLVEARGISIC
jgi:hypothetical protein